MKQPSKYTLPVAAIASLACMGTLSAQEMENALAPTLVVGGEEQVFDMAGSAAFVDAEEFRERGYINVNRMFARLPGVYVREEDGYGNFPNISLRGGDGTRSEKVTLMEDGILSAPAPYSAPAAYYSPRAARMSGIEILKGSSQIQYGPQTTGGVVNYLSTPIPDNTGYQPERTETSGKGGKNVTVIPASGEKVPNFYWRSTYGSDNTFFNHAYYGDTVETKAGKFGYLFELHQQYTEGFRDLDDGGNTGFELLEPMLKLSWEPNTAMEQRFEFKYGYTDFDADETYTGLTERDLARSPHRRYAGTKFDRMMTEHHRTYLKWNARPTDKLEVELAGYYNEFERNWYKISNVNGNSLHGALAMGNNTADYRTLTGTGVGELGIRANARSYKAYGVQFSGSYEFSTGSLDHDLGFGARWHYDEIRRFQRDDVILVDGMRGFSINRGIPGSGGNRLQESNAIALWLKDDIRYNALTVSPGVRYEHIDQSYTDYASDPTNTRTGGGSSVLEIIAPGVGFTYDLTDSDKIYAGIYKGFSVPAPRARIKDGTNEEESIGYELGYRHRGDGFSYELAGFFTDFDNLISSDAGLGGSDSTNAGEAEVFGIEAVVNYDPAARSGAGFNTPMYLSATWTSAELKTALSAGGSDDIYAGASPGAEIPYIPEWKLAGGVGFATEKWGVNLDATYTSDQYGTALNLGSPRTSSRQGKLDAALIFDLSAYYQLTENLKIVGGVQNVLDEVYTVSRLPEGPRVGSPRQLYAGFELMF